MTTGSFKKKTRFAMKRVTLFAIALVFSAQTVLSQNHIPGIQKIGGRHQMIVNGKPFLMLAGELGNSTASTMMSMEQVWPRLKELNLNTVLVPVYWELLEPQEGVFDFKLVDELILEARRNDLKLVLLWFGSWKNSMSSHAPGWVKTDQKRFPRSRSITGESQEILTPFSENNLKADQNAYKRLLSHIRDFDAAFQTVIMIQPENEIGMLPSARDYCQEASREFKKNVPAMLIDYMVRNKEALNSEFLAVWAENGLRTEGTWEEVFGKGLHTDEIFMAYYFALYTDRICAAGKKEYNIPAYVNAAMIRPGKVPGEYPSAGPLPHLLDIWRAGAPCIDFYSPDFYNPQFRYWNDLYTRQGNPLFIPEHNFDSTVAAKALYAFGHYEALGFSPFSVEQIPGIPLTPKELKLAKVYDVINQIKPLIDKNRGKGRIEGVLLDKDVKEAVFALGDVEFTARHTYNFGWEPGSQGVTWDPAGAILIQTGENEFFYAGFGVSLTMKSLKKDNPYIGILKTDRGYFEGGEWKVYQHLNGDQTHQGRHIRSFLDDVSIQRFTLYEYK